MRFFHTLIPALGAALSLGVTGTLAQFEEQVYSGIEHLSDASAELQFNVSQITNDTFSTTGTVRIYLVATLSWVSSKFQQDSLLGLANLTTAISHFAAKMYPVCPRYALY